MTKMINCRVRECVCVCVCVWECVRVRESVYDRGTEGGGAIRTERTCQRRNRDRSRDRPDWYSSSIVSWCKSMTDLNPGGRVRRVAWKGACRWANGWKYRNKSFSAVPWHVWLRRCIKKPAILLFEIIAFEKKNNATPSTERILISTKRKTWRNLFYRMSPVRGLFYKETTTVS